MVGKTTFVNIKQKEEYLRIFKYYNEMNTMKQPDKETKNNSDKGLHNKSWFSSIIDNLTLVVILLVILMIILYFISLYIKDFEGFWEK